MALRSVQRMAKGCSSASVSPVSSPGSPPPSVGASNSAAQITGIRKNRRTMRPPACVDDFREYHLPLHNCFNLSYRSLDSDRLSGGLPERFLSRASRSRMASICSNEYGTPTR